MNTDNFFIEEKDLELARSVCRDINSKIRGRAMANAAGANIAAKFFDEAAYSVDTESGLHNIRQVLEDIEISDIYINGSYIDVRVYFNEEEMCVPKSHFKHNLLPAAYMFIRLNDDLSGGSAAGFVLPENVEIGDIDGDYYPVQSSSLISFYDVESRLFGAEDNYDIEDAQIFGYLDGLLENKIEFYGMLIKSANGRQRLAKAAKAQYIFNFVSKTESVSDDDIILEVLEPDQEAASGQIGSVNNDDLVFERQNEELELDHTENIESSEEIYEELSSAQNSVREILGEIPAEQEEEPGNSEEGFGEMSSDQDDTLKISEESADAVIEEQSALQGNDGDVATNSFEYSTAVSPDLKTIEKYGIQSETPTEDQEQESVSGEYTVTSENSGESDNSEQIDLLYAKKEGRRGASCGTNGKLKGLFIIIVVLAAAGVFGCLGYDKLQSLSASKGMGTNVPENTENKQDEAVQDAMPNETVENTAPQTAGETAEVSAQQTADGVKAAAYIPAIEKNLDASVLVSNLKVDWEVPAGYASNVTAKRYLVKLGKIIQLNLKTELLLLSKPPVTNKIAVELKYNDGTRKFETAGIVTSSGEKSIDDIIVQVVNKTAGKNISIGTESFAKLQGNPILVIHL